MAGKPKISNETLVAFIKGELPDLKPTGSLAADARALGFQGKSPGARLTSRYRTLIEQGLLTEEFVKGIYRQFGQEQIDPIPDQKILDFINGRLEIKPTGNIRADGRALGFQGKTPGVRLGKRYRELIEQGLLTEEFVKTIYRQFGQERIDSIPDARILDFINGRLAIKPTGNLKADVRALGFQGKTAGGHLGKRYRALIEQGLLTEEFVKSIYRQFGQEHIDPIPDQKILDFINGRLDIKPTGNLKADGRKLGFQGRQAGKSLSTRLRQLIAEGRSIAGRTGAGHRRRHARR